MPYGGRERHKAIPSRDHPVDLAQHASIRTGDPPPTSAVRIQDIGDSARFVVRIDPQSIVGLGDECPSWGVAQLHAPQAILSGALCAATEFVEVIVEAITICIAATNDSVLSVMCKLPGCADCVANPHQATFVVIAVHNYTGLAVTGAADQLDQMSGMIGTATGTWQIEARDLLSSSAGC